jgi:hypothetical protein
VLVGADEPWLVRFPVVVDAGVDDLLAGSN